MVQSVKFINTNEILPEYDSTYEGWYVLDSNNRLYIGSSDGWKELTNRSEIFIGNLDDAPEDAKIIIDNTTDTSVEVYSATEIDNKMSVLSNDHTVFKREMTDTTVEIVPNIFYVWGEVTELDITLADSEDSTIYNEYMFQFTSGDIATTLSIPDGLTWYLDNNTILPNKTYQISIVNNLAVLGEF